MARIANAIFNMYYFVLVSTFLHRMQFFVLDSVTKLQ